jgi:uncharacterized protein with PIN domain
LEEPDVPRVAAAIEAGSLRLISAVTLPEASIAIESREGEAAGRALDLLLYCAGVEVVAADQDQAEIAVRLGVGSARGGTRRG